ncbi:MAG: chorismate synthase [Patescibacteria group bacterium]|nr:chorismate synthase [Patescibacteria group bacterium]
MSEIKIILENNRGKEEIIDNPVQDKKNNPEFFDDLRKDKKNPMPFSAPFGVKIRLSIFGDSHGKKIGFFLEGIPKNTKISEKEIQDEVDKRRSVSGLSTARQEADKIHIISGIKNRKTTGEKIRIEIFNTSTHSKSYENIRLTPRPGHADFTARKKYASVFDYRGGGFASGRMTACMVAAGAIAKKILNSRGVEIRAFTKQIGNIAINRELSFTEIKKNVYSNLVRCPDKKIAEKMIKEIEKAKSEKNSVGGIVECAINGLPIGLGEPLFNSAESVLSHAMFSIPAVKGVEFGAGFYAAKMKGSEHNDPFYIDKNKNIKAKTNNSGGILGGITNSMPVVFRLAIKPTASIGIEQDTINIKTLKNEKITISGRHDPCIVIRVPPVAEALSALVMLDLWERM